MRKWLTQKTIQDLTQELEQQREINRQLTERLEAIKFVFQPITENIRKPTKNVKIGHQRVKSDLDYRNTTNFHSVQPLINTQIRNQKTGLLSNFLKDLEEDDDRSNKNNPQMVVPTQTQLNIQIQPSALRKGHQILINQTNYTTVNQQQQTPQTALQLKKATSQMHLHQRSNSDGASGIFMNLSSKYEHTNTQNDTSQYSIITNINTDRNLVIGKNILEVQGILRGHYDGVRSLCFIDHFIASASEDCTIKLWDTEHLKFQSDQSNVEPLTTIRAHSGQIFALTSQQSLPTNRRYLTFYSGGTDGYIKQTSIPVDSLSHEIDYRGEITSSWEAHSDVVWSLKHHPIDQRLLSMSADGSVKMWKTCEKLQYSDSIYKKPLACYTYKRSINGNSYPITEGISVPSALEWLFQKSQSERIVCGYTDLASLIFYDVETTKVCQQVKYYSADMTAQCLQPNRIMYKSNQNYLISGHEDCSIRFFDQASGKAIKNLVAHADSVTDLTNIPQSQNLIASVSHDGSMRTWDVRTFQCLHEQTIHKNKYDESIHTIGANNYYVATGGADGLIKVFKQSLF